jgi:hypothetical protein
MARRDRKHFVRGPRSGAPTREQALAIGRALFDSITAERLDELAETDGSTGEDHDDDPVEGS